MRVFGPFVLCVSALVSGCAAFGPSRIEQDRFDYNQAVGQTNNEQMLLNLVRMRYRDVPVFMAVSSVLTQYVYSGGASANASIGTSGGEDLNSLGAAANVRYIERPTVTYSPMTGPDFAEQMLTPIPPELLFSLVESGWPADDLILMGLERINGLRNAPFRQSSEEDLERASPEFEQLIQTLIDLSVNGVLEFQKDLEHGGASLVLVDGLSDETDRLLARFRELADLDPSVSRYRVVQRRLNRAPDEITIRMRSLLALMGFLSMGVTIPDTHIESGLASPATPDENPPELAPLMRIQASAERPENAFVAIQYYGSWFFIEGRDETSREAFGLVTYLFMMMAPRLDSEGPLLTVPTG